MTDELFQKYAETFLREQRVRFNEMTKTLEAHLYSMLSADLTPEQVRDVQNTCDEWGAQIKVMRRSIVDSVNEFEREYRKRKREE